MYLLKNAILQDLKGLLNFQKIRKASLLLKVILLREGAFSTQLNGHLVLFYTVDTTV